MSTTCGGATTPGSGRSRWWSWGGRCRPGSCWRRAALRDQALGSGSPLDRLRYMFLDPAEAGRHVREVWLHGLECWTVRDGAEVRLDLGYAATTPPPAWVPLADARDGEGGGGR